MLFRNLGSMLVQYFHSILVCITSKFYHTNREDKLKKYFIQYIFNDPYDQYVNVEKEIFNLIEQPASGIKEYKTCSDC